MECCANCGQVYDVRLFDVRTEGHIRRFWWCPACAFAESRRGADVEPSPAWIERAALNQLPVKEVQLEPDRRPGRPATERRQGRLDRRRWSIQLRPPERRRSPSIGRRTLDWRV